MKIFDKNLSFLIENKKYGKIKAMRVCRLYYSLKRYDGTTPFELSLALEYARKNQKLSSIAEKLFHNQASAKEKECGLCDIISHYRENRNIRDFSI
ncbi:MAG: hypothetical protein N2Z80_02620 [Hydrogenothermaceae bacterium]|nr:hypothetical protein [Hydrogenothermaceae bacterium]